MHWNELFVINDAIIWNLFPKILFVLNKGNRWIPYKT